MAIRWQAGGKQLASSWQSAGNQLAISWQSDGNQLAISWQLDDNQWAIMWQSDCNQPTIRGFGFVGERHLQTAFARGAAPVIPFRLPPAGRFGRERLAPGRLESERVDMHQLAVGTHPQRW